VYFFALSSPLTQARDAMRMARYDIALEALDTVPAWLRNWPAWAALRAKADLGARTYQSPPDWESIGEDLRRQRADRPTDADLMILEAQYWLRQENYDQARTLAEAASKEDQHNAEAWFLLGLDRDLSGDTAAAVAYYRKAVEAAPASPQYRSNLARGLLELGTFPEALQEYRKIRQFPLARVEQALAHWAQGEMREAADAERDALKMLGDAGLSTRFYNRRAWLFRLPTKGIRLSSPEDKRCYALLGEAASRRLAGEAVAAFPPAECYDPPLAIRELLADDLCRFVDRPQLTLSAAARSLRQRLAMPEDCTGSARNPKSNQPASSLTNSLGMQFALIPAGEFQMGSANGSDNERPVHTVRISKPFYLGIYEVTQDQWEAVMGHNPSRFKGDANRPVEMVSWEEVQKFIDELNTREGGAKYRLPMEAEWEYAARAGSQTAYSFGDDSRQLGKYGWFRGNADNTTHPVGTLQPNAWGLYDMHGNVWEWVQDWRGQYPAGPVTDPQGPASGSARVIRGGWWSGEAMRCRPAYREAGAPDYRNDDLGFRLLRTAP
jgi:formylglycine-generating enzyme required for sulfatase activity